MATEAEIIGRVRREIGDLPELFRHSIRGTGEQNDFDLPAKNLLPNTVTVFQLEPDGSIVDLAATDDYTLDNSHGIITFVTVPNKDDRVIVEGSSYGIFSDEELLDFIHDATSQHLKNRMARRRYRDGHGFIKYDSEPMQLETMPAEENILITLLTTAEALWALATDASLDIDVQTSEGTSLPRGQRWRQLTAQIELIGDRYKELSLMMGVGLFAPEVMTMRRVSRTTGRLVPVFKEREYDENGPPIRKTPAVSERDSDPDGPESPWWSGGYGY